MTSSCKNIIEKLFEHDVNIAIALKIKSNCGIEDDFIQPNEVIVP